MKAFRTAAVILLALSGAAWAQSSSTTPVNGGPSPEYSIPVGSRSTSPEAGWTPRQFSGVVRSLLPTDPYSGGSREVVVESSQGTDRLIKLNSNTLIVRGGRTLSFNSVRSGDRVSVTFDAPAAQDGSFDAAYVIVAPAARPGPQP